MARDAFRAIDYGSKTLRNHVFLEAGAKFRRSNITKYYNCQSNLLLPQPKYYFYAVEWSPAVVCDGLGYLGRWSVRDREILEDALGSSSHTPGPGSADFLVNR